MPEPFTAHIPDAVLDDLRNRLCRMRWPDELEDAGWRYGAPLDFVRRVCAYWTDGFDWRAQEMRLNALPQFTAEVDGQVLHFVHAGPEAGEGMPLIITNGWPSSIFEYLELIPKLTAAGFEVVAPALPGYGFSARPTRPGTDSARIAVLFASLMRQLGHEHFIAHGSDIGAGVVEAMRRDLPDRLLGAHFSNVYWAYPQPDDPSPEEAGYFARIREWQGREGAYAMLQATKPQTLAYGLNDSPAGLAAWVLEKCEAWTDGGAQHAIGLDALCANLTLYWATETIGSSIRLYAESAASRSAQRPPERGSVPSGVLLSPRDILPAPRAWGERWLNLQHWTEAPRGGHFPGWEIPDLLAADLAAFRDRIS